MTNKPRPIGMQERIERIMQDVERLRRRPLQRTPVGHVDLFAGSTLPLGWLPMVGGTASTVDFPELYHSIGTTFGATTTVGGVLHFRLPTMAAPANFVYGIRAVS